ncbi:MAG: ABC transporter permease [Patescibacteria group bacterium]|jgi:ABC-2 type transport system permease protein
MNYFLSDWYYLSIRNIKQIWRPLLALIPSLFIPVFFFAVNSAAFKSVSLIPGFPSDSYLKFIAPVALFTAIFFSAGNAGIELVVDISSGYFKKLTIMPINHLAIILSKLTEVAVQAIIQGLIVLILLLAIGVTPSTGFLGILAIFAMMIIFAMGWSCISMVIALRTGNPRLVQSMFVLVFPFLYLTTSQMPKDLLPASYAKLVTLNPVTYVIEGVRGLFIRGWGDPSIWQGFAVAGIFFVIMIFLTLGSFKKTLK